MTTLPSPVIAKPYRCIFVWAQQADDCSTTTNTSELEDLLNSGYVIKNTVPMSGGKGQGFKSMHGCLVVVEYILPHLAGE